MTPWSNAGKGGAKSRVPVLLALGLVLTGLLGGCSETRLAVFAVKKISLERAKAPAKQKTSVKRKIGKPYQIASVWYYPKDEPNYDRTGIASWYGPKFHGKPTANGEIFDMNRASAAHKTLPLPSLVRVTNLDNGRSMVVRINDRGPFVTGRIIDLSKRAAQLLGFANKGVAKVRVAVLSDARGGARVPRPQNDEELRKALPAVPRSTVSAQNLPPPQGAEPTRERAKKNRAVVEARVANAGPRQQIANPAAAAAKDERVDQMAVRPGVIFVQAGAFSQHANATRLSARLSRHGFPRIARTMIGGREIYRVRLGPYARVAEADVVLNKLIGDGFTDARIIVD